MTSREKSILERQCKVSKGRTYKDLQHLDRNQKNIHGDSCSPFREVAVTLRAYNDHRKRRALRACLELAMSRRSRLREQNT